MCERFCPFDVLRNWENMLIRGASTLKRNFPWYTLTRALTFEAFYIGRKFLISMKNSKFQSWMTLKRFSAQSREKQVVHKKGGCRAVFGGACSGMATDWWHSSVVLEVVFANVSENVACCVEPRNVFLFVRDVLMECVCKRPLIPGLTETRHVECSQI